MCYDHVMNVLDLIGFVCINTFIFVQGLIFCGLLTVDTIELDLNRGVSPFGPIRRQDTKIGGCHLAFFPITFVQGRGLNNESS